MIVRRRALGAAALAVACVAAGVLLYQWRAGAFGSRAPDPAVVGRMVLEAKLAGLDGRLQSLDQWRGHVLVVNFWATWCAPCREEIPGFIKFQEQHRAEGVQFLGIAIDQLERVGPYAKDIGINYPVLVGGMEVMNLAERAGNKLGVLPFTLVLDRKGVVTGTTVGVLKPEKLESLVRPLI